jgi:hypothetical protein
MGDPWVPVNPMGKGLGKILNRRGMEFLIGLNIFHGFGFGTAKSSGLFLSFFSLPASRTRRLPPCPSPGSSAPAGGRAPLRLPQAASAPAADNACLRLGLAQATPAQFAVPPRARAADGRPASGLCRRPTVSEEEKPQGASFMGSSLTK